MYLDSHFIFRHCFPDRFSFPFQMVLFTHIRLAHSFGSYETRLQCVQARLQALSVLVYCNALQVNITFYFFMYCINVLFIFVFYFCLRGSLLMTNTAQI